MWIHTILCSRTGRWRRLMELKDLAVGHSWWVVVPRLLPRPPAKCSMAAGDYLPCLSIPCSCGAISLSWGSSQNKIQHVIFLNAVLFTWPLCSTHQSHPGSPASLRPWFSVNPVQSVVLNSYLSNRKWNWKETRPPGKSWWKLLLMGQGGNVWNKCFRTKGLLKYMDPQGPNLSFPRGFGVGCDEGLLSPSSIFSHMRSQRFSTESQMFLLEKGLEIVALGSRKGGSLLLKKNTKACFQLQLVLCADRLDLGVVLPWLAFLCLFLIFIF